MADIDLNDAALTQRRQAGAEKLATMLDKQTRILTKHATAADGVDVPMAFSAIADVVGHWLKDETSDVFIAELNKLRDAIAVSRARHRQDPEDAG